MVFAVPIISLNEGGPKGSPFVLSRLTGSGLDQDYNKTETVVDIRWKRFHVRHMLSHWFGSNNDGILSWGPLICFLVQIQCSNLELSQHNWKFEWKTHCNRASRLDGWIIEVDATMRYLWCRGWLDFAVFCNFVFNLHWGFGWTTIINQIRIGRLQDDLGSPDQARSIVSLASPLNKFRPIRKSKLNYVSSNASPRNA